MARRTNSNSAKRTTRRMREAHIGTHHVRTAPSRPARGPAASVGFSNPKKSTRAKRGMVNQVLPSTSTRESEADYSRRVSRAHYTEKMQRSARIRRLVVALVVVAVAACVSVGVGVAVYMGSVTGKMGLGDSNAQSALTAPSENAPYYMLIAGEFSEPEREYVGPSLLMLARVDVANKQVSLMSVPANTQVMLNDGNYHRISEAQTRGGDAGLIGAVSEFAGVPISHFAKTDADRFKHLVDSLGGLEIDVTEEVDDPVAGSIYIPAGRQTLDGEAALTFCRASNFVEGVTTRGENQCAVVKELIEKLLAADGIGMVFTLDGISGDIQSDYTIGDIMSLIESMQGFQADSVYAGFVPGYRTTGSSDGIEYYVPDSTWATMLEAFVAGNNPADVVVVEGTTDPASFTVFVRNGAGITGAATQVSDILTAGGFKVEDTGNADMYVYEETLVVYKDDAFADAAATVVKGLGMGRAIPSNGFYAFDTDVLVVIGKDWKPLN